MVCTIIKCSSWPIGAWEIAQLLLKKFDQASYWFVSFEFQVQAHWLRYTEKMDRMVEEAFRLNVKWSLQELSRAINGDGKSAPNPLLRVKVVLEGDKVSL